MYQWACGTAFTDICQLTDVMEVCHRSHWRCLSVGTFDADGSLQAPQYYFSPLVAMLTSCCCGLQARNSCFIWFVIWRVQGSIVRTVVRLDETCREFRDAARVMGDTALWAQMTAASAAIKRDVVFAASLYVA